MPMTANLADGYLTGSADGVGSAPKSARTIWMIAYLILVQGKYICPRMGRMTEILVRDCAPNRRLCAVRGVFAQRWDLHLHCCRQSGRPARDRASVKVVRGMRRKGRSGVLNSAENGCRQVLTFMDSIPAGRSCGIRKAIAAFVYPGGGRLRFACWPAGSRV
ncbi:hypothetical protein D3C71_88450 [compost metagenome]